MTTDEGQLKWTPHAIYTPPGAGEIAGDVRLHGGTAEEAVIRLWRMRESVIAQEKADPFRYAFEPPIWQVCRALLGLPCYDQLFVDHVQARFGWTWAQWCEAMRTHLGFKEPVRVLLIMGGSRSGKSNFSAKIGQEILTFKQRSNVYPLHENETRSIRDQQELFWRYMPPEFKETTRTDETYVAYKRKTGFADMSFINPLGSLCEFKTYEQDRDKTLEGISADLLLPDEQVPPDWLPTMETRIYERHGIIIVTFTPYQGYSATVKMFGDGAVVAQESTGFLLPRDGGEPDRARALGLTQSEYAEVVLAERQKRAARAPESRPEDVCAWLERGSQSSFVTGHLSRGGMQEERAKADGFTQNAELPTGTNDKGPMTSDAGLVHRPFGRGRAQPDVPTGRAFEQVPRVWRCANPRYACVFFHSADNPYGNPKDAIETQLQKSPAVVRERVYGIAEKLRSAKFPKFNRKIHVLPAAAMPGPDGGTHFMFCDPHPDKNFFMGWLTVNAAGAFFRQEWPGKYPIPTVGVPGRWAVPSGKNNGINDGKADDGQKSFGFGLLRYKFEIARLEGWTDWAKWAQDTGAGPDTVADFEEIQGWDERNGAVWPIAVRMIDSRAASSPRVENDRPVTLQSDMQDIGLSFDLAPGKDVEVGVALINAALDWQEEEKRTSNTEHRTPNIEGKIEEKRGWFNAARLHFSEECGNTIFAMECWTNAEKDRGACKEPIDLLRWYYTSDLDNLDASRPVASGGFSYARTAERSTGFELRQAGAVPKAIQRARCKVR